MRNHIKMLLNIGRKEGYLLQIINHHRGYEGQLSVHFDWKSPSMVIEGQLSVHFDWKSPSTLIEGQ